MNPSTASVCDGGSDVRLRSHDIGEIKKKASEILVLYTFTYGTLDCTLVELSCRHADRARRMTGFSGNPSTTASDEVELPMVIDGWLVLTSMPN